MQSSLINAIFPNSDYIGTNLPGFRNATKRLFFHGCREQLIRYQGCLNFSSGGQGFLLSSKLGGHWNKNIPSFQIVHKCFPSLPSVSSSHQVN